MADTKSSKTLKTLLTENETSALLRKLDAHPMPSVSMGIPQAAQQLYDGMNHVAAIPTELYERYDVKRGLRNADGSGVLVGLTTISNVHGYKRVAGRIEPDEGQLTLRGYHMADLVAGTTAEGRFGYEEKK